LGVRLLGGLLRDVDESEDQMRVTGYAIREAIKQWELRRDTAARAFDGSLKVFDEERGTKESPDQIIQAFLKAELAISKLQVAQARYNLWVLVDTPERMMSLSQAIKMVGGVARAEKMWRSATGPKKERYGYSDDERDPNKIVAKPTITVAHAVAQATLLGKRAGSFRAAIAVANAKELEIEDLDETLFE